jgi:hypothetical protein
MSKGVRSVLVGIAAAAVAMAGFSGMARADNSTAAKSGDTISTLPAKALLNAGKTPAEFVTVQLVVPSGVDCLTGMTAAVVGKSTAVTVTAAPDCAAVTGSAVWTVTANAAAKRQEGVVTFISTPRDASSRKVGTLNVRVVGAETVPPADHPTATAYPAGAEITTFPAKAVLLGGATPQSVTVKLAIPTGLACPADFSTRVVGQRDAVTVSAPSCPGGFVTWTVTASPVNHKRHAVVKFIATNPTDRSRTVSTLNVKVNPGARPAKPAKGQGHQGSQGQGQG